ncbi:GAF domain-containing protein [Methanosarcina sp.]|uniref:GAF domain-containing protein n=1 Tax=Methanosarcina sp. TaxID=2213 RepID=UPI003C79714C
MNANRVSGVDIVGGIPWGTHFCQFYQTNKELMDIAIPYFKAGLENNEFCMWITSESLDVERAREALRKAIPDFNIYLKRDQIEIIPYTDWYLKEGTFDSEKVLDNLGEKLNQALDNGYEGLRAIENTCWLKKENFNYFINYEKKLDSIIGKHLIIALCTYSLDKCNTTETIELVANHQFSLVKKEGKWKQIKSPTRKSVIELDRRDTILETIGLINQIIHSTLDFDEIMQKTVSEAARAIGCETAAISLREGKHWVLSYVHGFPQDVIGTEMDDVEEPHAVLAIKTKKPVAINDAFNDERVNRNHMKKWGVRSVLVVPLIIRDKVIGVLFFNYHRSTFAFDDNDLYFASQLASSISLALENSRLFENLKMELAERKRAEDALKENKKQLIVNLEVMTRLQKLGTLFVREGNLESVLGKIVDAAIAISGADFGNIQLLDPKSSDLKIVAQRGFPQWWLDFWNKVSEGRGTCGTALERGERVIVEDVEQSPVFVGTQALEIQLKAGVRAVQSTPLLSRSGRLLGMFSTHYKTPHRPDDRALRLLDLLAHNAADIIERAQIEEALHQATEHERFLADVVEKANVSVGVGAPDGRLLMFNQAFADLTGYSREELIQKQLTWNTDLTPPEWREYEAARLSETLRTRQPVRYEKEYLRKDGTRVPIEVFVQPEFDTAGNLINYRSFLTDITERKRTEEALRKSEKRFRALVTASSEVIYRMSPDWRCMNRLCGRGFLTDTENLNPTWLQEYILPEDQPYVTAVINEAIRTKSIFELEHRVRQADGSIGWTLSRAIPILDANGEIIEWFGTASDITERKQEEQKILRYNRVLKGINRIFSSAMKAETEEELGQACLSVAMAVTGSQIGFVGEVGEDELLHDIAISDMGWEQCTMYDRTGHLRPPGDFILHGLYGCIIDTGKSFFSNEPQSHPNSIGLPQGHPELKSFLGVPLVQNGKTIGLITVANREGGYDCEQQEDLEAITPAVTQALQRKRAEEKLAKIDIARQKEIHHRIKNNLQVISSLLDLQAEQFRSRECIKDSEVLTAFMESQDRVTSMALIHEELYKGEGLETLNFSPYLETLIENLFQTYKLGDSSISLNLDLEENVFYDMDTVVPLGMIINELVSNSLKHAFQGRDKGSVHIKLYREEIQECINIREESKNKGCKSINFVLTISDNGIGIPESLEIEELESLGMQLVISLVDQLDGTIDLKRNNGTEFIIRFTVTKRGK